MSIIKKINAKFLGIIAVLVAIFALSACEPSPAVQARREATDLVNEALTKVIFSNYDEVVNSFTLVKHNATYGVDFTWETSNPEVIDVVDEEDALRALVKRPNFEDGNKTAVLTVTASREYSYLDKDGYETNKTVEVLKEFTFTVLALGEGQSIRKIAEVKAADFELGAELGIQGIVTGLFSLTRGGFFVTDDTGTIFVYANYEEGKLNLGDEVTVYGIKGDYYGAVQVTKQTGGQVSFTVISNNNPLPAAEEIAISEIALTDPADKMLPGQRFRVYALLTYEQDGVNFNYYLSDPHTGDKIQIYYRSYVPETSDLADYVNEYVNITVTVYYYDNRIPMWTTDYSEVEGSIELAEAPSFTDQDKAELVEKDVAKLFGDLTATSLTTIQLPAENTAYGATITWEALDANAEIVDGVLTWQVVSENTNATIKATIVVGDYTLVKEYVVTVQPLVPGTVADFLAAEKDELVVLEGVVFNYNQGAYLIDDEGDSVLLYYFSEAENGDRVIVIGKRSEFNYCPQMQSAKIITVVSKGNVNPLTPTPMTIEEIHAVDFKTTDLWNSYIQVEGTVVPDGSYFNLQDGELIISLYQSNATVLETLKGKKVALNLWFYGISRTDGTGVWRMVFAGLEGEYQVADMTVEEKLQAVAATLPVKENQEVVSNLVLPLTGDHEATIAWASDNEAALTAEGVVTRGAEDVTVNLTATITIGEEELVVVINVIVKAEVAEILTVEEFLALDKGATASVTGYIYVYDDGSYLVSENGTAVLAYKFKGAEHGDLVVLSGKKDVYNGTPQLASGAVLEETISKGNALPLTAVPMTIEEIVTSEFPGANLFGKYIEITGTVIPDGSYYLLEENGKQLSLYYSNNAVLAELLNQEATIKVIFYGNQRADGTGAWRVIFAGHEGEYVLPEYTPEQKIAAAKAEVQIVDGQDVTGDLELPATGKHDVAITWASNNAAIDAATGVVTRPAIGEADVAVTLTATFAVDGVEEVVEYIVTVKAEVESTGEVVTVEAKYPKEIGTTNMASAPANNAASIGLDESIFTVLSIKNDPNNQIGLNNAGQIRIYTDRNTGNGNTLEISVADGYKIAKVEFVFGASTNNPTGELILGDATHNLGTTDLANTTLTYEGLDITSFSLQNTQTGGTKNAQIYILAINITYVK